MERPRSNGRSGMRRGARRADYIHPRTRRSRLGGPLGYPVFWLAGVGKSKCGTTNRTDWSPVSTSSTKLRAVESVILGACVPFILQQHRTTYTSETEDQAKIQTPREYFKRIYGLQTAGMNYHRQLMMTIEEIGHRPCCSQPTGPCEPSAKRSRHRNRRSRIRQGPRYSVFFLVFCFLCFPSSFQAHNAASVCAL